MLTRDEFDRRGRNAKHIGRRLEKGLAIFSVAGGVLQLLFLGWADATLSRSPRVGIAVSAFVAYVVTLAVLLRRRQQRLRAAMPACPHCGACLDGLSERVAVATGKCDQCGGKVIEAAPAPAEDEAPSAR